MSNNENLLKLRQHPYFSFLVDIVRQSGLIVLDFYEKQDKSITYKKDESPLTKADLLTHNHIIKELSAVSSFPIISEESEKIYTNENTYWLVDPLDGTKEFINKNDEFTINIALIENNFPTIGIVYIPVTGLIYFGGKDLCSIKMDTSNQINEISVSNIENPIRVVASRSHLDNTTKNFIHNLGNTKLTRTGSSLKFCLIAEGLADIYPRLSPTSEWDTAAAQAIVEGAGGSVLQINGNRLKYQKPNIINPSFIVRGNIT